MTTVHLDTTPPGTPAPYTGHDLARALNVKYHLVLTHRWADKLETPRAGSGREYRFTLGQIVAARCCQTLHTRNDRSMPTRQLVRTVCRSVPDHIDAGHPQRLLIVESGTWAVRVADDLDPSHIPPGPAMWHLFDLHQALASLTAERIVAAKAAA
jgi:hypothetical protein